MKTVLDNYPTNQITSKAVSRQQTAINGAQKNAKKCGHVFKNRIEKRGLTFLQSEAFFRLRLRSFGCNFWPNKTVKGTRSPDAVLKVGFLIGFGCFAERPSAVRPLPLR